MGVREDVSYDYDLICIGCGPAGEKAATQASYFGHTVAIVEREALPGGAMVNTGTIPSKTLRETALALSALNRCPIPGFESPSAAGLSMPRLMAKRLHVQEQEHDRIERAIDRHAIEFVRGTGRLADAHTVEIRTGAGTSIHLTGRHVLIATGSSPLRPDHVPFDHPCVVDADGVLELERMPTSMIIVGGGVIGCEYACLFKEVDVEVTLVHPRAEVLPFLDVDCRRTLVDAMCQRGIDMQLERAVKAVVPLDAGGVRVDFEDGGDATAEVLLWAAGRRSNTQDLGLEAIGVEMGDRGLIKVDEKYRTSVPSIYAAGDVIGFPALAATSMEQGRIAACDMFSIRFKDRITDMMPIGIYTIPAVSSVGLTEAEAVGAGRAVVTGCATYRDNVRGRMLGDADGLMKCVFDRDTHKLLGATIVGEQATELIHLAQTVMSAGLGIEHFIQTCFNYPSLSELYKYASYDALQAIDVRKRAA